jgi:hypothetical protein
MHPDERPVGLSFEETHASEAFGEAFTILLRGSQPP